MSGLTPMMKQYFKIKEQYRDAILFFRLGDFYEMFYDDAHTASSVLNIALTGKSCGGEERAPMCGVPFHAADSYIAKLVAAGFKVAICEQAEDPATAKGIVKREVVRLVTPGTILNDELLSQRTTNYMCSIFKTGKSCGITFCEASTGEIMTTSFEDDGNCDKIKDEISKFMPVEIIYNIEVQENRDFLSFIKERTSALPVLYNDLYFETEYTRETVAQRFGSETEKLDDLMACATGAILTYIHQTQRAEPTHIKNIEVYTAAQYMYIDSAARRNLELVESMRDKTKKGTLFSVLDHTKTVMGSRMLKGFIIRPLLGCAAITSRLGAVSALTKDLQMREGLSESFSYISDIERVASRIVMGTANARDLVRLRTSLQYLPQIKELLSGTKSTLLTEQSKKIDTLEDVYDLLCRGIVDEPPLNVRDGGMIREGFSEELDELRRAKENGSGYLDEVEAEEREITGIKNLKIKYNRVFGYYIEISNVNKDKVPDYYIRKQTVVNGERYITPRLKEIEGIVLGAAEKMVAQEYKLFTNIRERIAGEIARIQKTASAIGVSDALNSLAHVAVKNNYCCPSVNVGDKIEIKNGRHPVIEFVSRDNLFVPNDTNIDCGENRLAIITGPNMAGKSTYMRQTALIAIMAQMGSFVPCESCDIGIIDKVFTRVGASDDLAAGQSTFMVEMSEVASILKNATGRSLIILDEIGRGTSTYDGLAIAWAVLEYCAVKLRAKTLFATHYHELTQLEEKMEGVINLSIAVKKRNDDIFFLRKIVRGGADESYGVEVAKLAGVPESIIDRAKKILTGIESENGEVKVVSKAKKSGGEQNGQIGFSNIAQEELIDKIKKIDANILSPIEALNTLFEIVKEAKEI